jgi:Fe-S cluster assembly scaffold protein SufB
VKYVEKHYGEGDGDGARVLNPETVIHLEENSYMEMVSVQIKGVDSTVRNTVGDLADGATLIISEKIMTHEDQVAETNFSVDMNGIDCHADLVSRSVARGNSKQIFNSTINGNKRCTGHSECDAIIMDNAHVVARPALEANDLDASLIHEAAIGKIAGEQIIKLETLGLTEQEAEEQIISGFLK